MALEDLLTKLITALDANTAAHKGTAAVAGGKGVGAAATTAAAKTTAKATAPAVSFDEVKAAAAKVMDKHGKPFAKKMIKDVGGAPELATVKPEKFGSLLAAFEKALSDPADDAEDEGEDEL